MKSNKINNFSIRSLTIILCLFLTACSSVSPPTSQDGPPKHDIDVSKIPNAVPKAEPLSKYGNKSYKVRGKRYTILNKADGYRARGMASWYGTKFHSRRTSSGERYDMFAMTAASRNLPIPSYAEVTNLRNGRKVIVKVNDRGPFEKNRLIDLSYVAAKKLDVMRTGTALVEVRAITPGTRYADQDVRRNNTSNAPFGKNYSPRFAQLSSSSTNSRVYLQVGAFSNKQHAHKLRIQVAQLISHPVRVQTGKKNNLLIYKVQIGPVHGSYANRKQVLQQLTKLGLDKAVSVVKVG